MHIDNMRAMADLHTTGDLLRHWRLKKGYPTVGDLAKAMGMARSTVSDHENDRRGLKYSVARRYETFLGMPRNSLLDERRLNQLTQTIPINAEVRLADKQVPLLSCHDLDQFRMIVAGEPPMSENKIDVPPGFNVGPRTFAFPLTDKAMEGAGRDSFYEGDFAIVDPDRKIEAGDIVAIVDAPGIDRAIIRRYRIAEYNPDGSAVYEFVPINTSHPSISAASALNVKIVGRVVGAFRVF
jgi:SOS-response transcriptional repressor LexA